LNSVQVKSTKEQLLATTPRFSINDLTKIAVFAAIIAVLGLPGSINLADGVPITAQTLGVMLAGAVLGKWRGAAAVVLFEVLVAIGFPLLSGGRGGLSVFVGPSVGFLIGWIFGAFVIGLIAHRKSAKPHPISLVIGLVLGGIAVVYLFGIPVMASITGMQLDAAVVASAVYLPGDLIKVVIATVITLALWRAYPKAFKN
jgi:biotin transport system substrate-specific component